MGDIIFNDGTAMPYADFAALDDDEENASTAMTSYEVWQWQGL